MLWLRGKKWDRTNPVFDKSPPTWRCKFDPGRPLHPGSAWRVSPRPGHPSVHWTGPFQCPGDQGLFCPHLLHPLHLPPQGKANWKVQTRTHIKGVSKHQWNRRLPEFDENFLFYSESLLIIIQHVRIKVKRLVQQVSWLWCCTVVVLNVLVPSVTSQSHTHSQSVIIYVLL